MNTRTHSSERAVRRVAGLLTGMAAVALTATLAGPVPSASAMIVSRTGGPGSVSFADLNGQAQPMLVATPASGNKVALSAGAVIVTPDPTADAGTQTAELTFTLSKRAADGQFRFYKKVTYGNLSLAYQGRNVPQWWGGPGTIATVDRGHLSSYRLDVKVTWWVDDELQSFVHVQPDQASELSCQVSGCSTYVPGGGQPAQLGIV